MYVYRVFLAAALVGTLAGPAFGAAQAEGTQAGASGELGAGPAMDEIVVTARKRREVIQSVPVSVAVFPASEIAQAGLSGIKDIAAFTANFSYHEAFGRNNLERPVIRGMSNVLGAANAAFFIDGVFVSGAIASTPLFDLARVEVLKGPNTALYGRGTLSGAINYVTKRPGNDFTGRVSVTGAEHQSYDINARLSGPLVRDKLAFSLAARGYGYGGEYRNTGPGGGKVGGEESRSVTGALRFSPSDRFGAYLRLYYQHDNDDHVAAALQPNSANNCFLDTTGYFCGKIKSPDTVALNLDVFDDPGINRDTFRAALHMDWMTDGLRLTSISSYSNDDLKDQRDNDFLPVATFGGAFHVTSDTRVKSYSQELRLNSMSGGPVRWLVGGYFYHQSTSDELTALLFSGPRTTLTPDETVNNYALFGSVDYDLTDRLTSTLELRAAWDRIAIAPTLGRQTQTFKSITPRLALNYALSDRAIAYVTVAKGTKPGGFNTDLFNSGVPDSERVKFADFLTFNEEQAWNYEIGTKTNWANRRVTLNLAGFFIDWTKQQLTTSFPIVGQRRPRPLIHNAGKTQVWGFEAELYARPTEHWTVAASYGFARGEFKRFLDQTNERLTGNASVAGNRTPRAPKHTVNLSSTLTWPLADALELFVRGDMSYRSSRFVQIHNLAKIGAFTKVNLRAGVDWHNLRLTVFANNLFDNRTPADVTRFFDGNSPFLPRAFLVTLPRGRQLGVTVSYAF